jgi:AcrR family transcriptional regulator
MSVELGGDNAYGLRGGRGAAGVGMDSQDSIAAMGTQELGPRAKVSVDKIFDGTIRAMLQMGAGRMTMRDVCRMAGVARGTLYRYFPTKEKLLEAVTAHMREQFDLRLVAATQAHTDPVERLGAVIDFIGQYLDSQRPHRLLEVEPEFALGYYRRNFSHFVAKTQRVLDPVFDDWERATGARLDREFLTEFLVRYIFSDLLAPAGPGRRRLLEQLMQLAKDVGGRSSAAG